MLMSLQFPSITHGKKYRVYVLSSKLRGPSSMPGDMTITVHIKHMIGLPAMIIYNF